MKLSVKNFIIMILIGIVLFFIIRISTNVSKHVAYKDDFNEKCIKAGGWTYIPSGTKGFSKSICFKKEAIITIGGNNGI